MRNDDEVCCAALRKVVKEGKEKADKDPNANLQKFKS